MPEQNRAEYQPANRLLVRAGGLLLMVVVLIALAFLPRAEHSLPQPTPIHERLVPTPLSGPPTPTTRPTGERLPAFPDIKPPDLPEPYTLRWRVGVGVPDGQSPLIYRWSEPRPGWYLNWTAGVTATAWLSSTVHSDPTFNVPTDAQAGMEFIPMVRTRQGNLTPDTEKIVALAAALPGKTWLIGNEPDVLWQDNATPEQYARAYHLAYTTIKETDPTAQIAIGGISQITPLRLSYLEQIWKYYREHYGEEMPVDVWTMHAFVLQEKAGDWGVDIPPGFDNTSEGEPWGIEDHDDLALVQEQITRMRAWMKDHNQQEKPLWITEYGILLPADYGFDVEVVRRFLLESYDLFNSMVEPGLGYGADDNRLVQRWVWFSSNYDRYPTGDLFTPLGQPTGIMHALSAYLAEYDSQPK